ncbi:MAG: hypothetical protein VX466_08295, partial [Myxococcota bacterium]|nr:hypothetical protein [Myxococcota bacterium]
DAPRTASLPERTIQVAGGSGLAGASPATPTRPTPPADRAAGAAPATPAPEAAQSISALPNAPLVVGALAAVVVAAAAALGWSLARRRAARAAQPASSTGTSTSPAPGAVRLRDAEKTLQRACDAGDPDLALGSLAAVARLRWPDAPPLNAADWARRLASDELTRAVEEVQRVRYSQERGAWSGDELWQTYSRARRSKRSARKRDRTPLPALYPTGARGQTPA